MSALSTGGRESLFCREGFNRCTISEYLVPVEQLARICGMEYLPPFVIHGTRELTGPEIGRHAHDYRRVITAVRDDRIDWEAARSFPRLNTDLDAVITK
jgi:glutathione-regulated potassium-efflux system ancillary protein KefG